MGASDWLLSVSSKVRSTSLQLQFHTRFFRLFPEHEKKFFVSLLSMTLFLPHLCAWKFFMHLFCKKICAQNGAKVLLKFIVFVAILEGFSIFTCAGKCQNNLLCIAFLHFSAFKGVFIVSVRSCFGGKSNTFNQIRNLKAMFWHRI